jgi:predicted nucleic acid-binding OB-fold protein
MASNALKALGKLYNFVLDKMDSECAKVFEQEGITNMREFVTKFATDDKLKMNNVARCLEKRQTHRRNLRFLIITLMVSALKWRGDMAKHKEVLEGIRKPKTISKEEVNHIIKEAVHDVVDHKERLWKLYNPADPLNQRRKLLNVLYILNNKDIHVMVSMMRKVKRTPHKNIVEDVKWILRRHKKGRRKK